MLLGAASQRIEYLALEFIGTPWLLEILDDWKKHERGSIPGPTECCIMVFVISMILKPFLFIGCTNIILHYCSTFHLEMSMGCAHT